MITRRAIAQLTVAVVAHGPDPTREEEAVIPSRGDRPNAASDLLRNGRAIGRLAKAQLPIGVIAHAPEGAIGLRKKAVAAPAGNAGHLPHREEARRDGLA